MRLNNVRKFFARFEGNVENVFVFYIYTEFIRSEFINSGSTNCSCIKKLVHPISLNNLQAVHSVSFFENFADC